jgi:hypothetical protein
LDISDVQSDKLAAAKSAYKKDRDHRLISLSVQRLAIGLLEQLARLIDIQPISQPLS